MAYRFTNTDKWNDAWFSNLKPIEKLLFNYLCDNCDCAGFIEIITKNWANDIGVDRKQIEGALKGLRRGLIYSKSEDCIYLRTFLKHQKNLPLNENNQAHKGIIKRFKLYLEKFEISDISIFIARGLEGASKGLESPYGIGNGIGNDKEYLEKESIKEDVFNFKKSFIDLGVNENVLNDWLVVRKAKKTVNTETAFNSIVEEIKKSGKSANECIMICAKNSWAGYKYKWDLNESQKNNNPLIHLSQVAKYDSDFSNQ